MRETIFRAREKKHDCHFVLQKKTEICNAKEKQFENI